MISPSFRIMGAAAVLAFVWLVADIVAAAMVALPALAYVFVVVGTYDGCETVRLKDDD